MNVLYPKEELAQRFLFNEITTRRIELDTNRIKLLKGKVYNYF